MDGARGEAIVSATYWGSSPRTSASVQFTTGSLKEVVGTWPHSRAGASVLHCSQPAQTKGTTHQPKMPLGPPPS